MIRGAQKLSPILGCMRWRLLRFSGPALAYSDQPVALWPIGVDLIDKRPAAPKLGALNAPEIRVPIAPDLLLLMTWDDPVPIRASPAIAAETNALVVAQADKQWMHRPGTEPSIAKWLLKPISRALDPAYDHPVAVRSMRHRTAQKFADQMMDKPYIKHVKVITEIRATKARAGRRSTRRRS